MALPALKKKSSGIYYVDLRSRGGGRVSLETRDRAVAVEKRRDLLKGGTPDKGPSRLPDGGPTMKELFDRAQVTVWKDAKSQATIRSNVKILNGLIGDEGVRNMTYTRLEKLVTELSNIGYAPGTVKRKMDAVSKVLRMATRWTDDEGRPLLAAKPTMPTISVKNTKDRTLSRTEETAVFDAIELRRRAEPQRQWRRFASLFRFLLDTGARLGETLTVGPDSLSTIDNGGEDVTLVTFARYRTKNDKPRSVPLTDAALDALDALADDLGMDDSGREIFFPFTSATAWYMLKNIRVDLKKRGIDIDDVTLHTLRHTALTRLARGGMDLRRLQLWAGHSDPKITAERYIHTRADDLVGGLDILNGSGPGSPANVTFREAAAKRANRGTPTLQ